MMFIHTACGSKISCERLCMVSLLLLANSLPLLPLGVCIPVQEQAFFFFNLPAVLLSFINLFKNCLGT